MLLLHDFSIVNLILHSLQHTAFCLLGSIELIQIPVCVPVWATVLPPLSFGT